MTFSHDLIKDKGFHYRWASNEKKTIFWLIRQSKI